MRFIFGFITESLYSLVSFSLIYVFTKQLPQGPCLKLFKSYGVGMHKIYLNFKHAIGVTIKKENVHTKQKTPLIVRGNYMINEKPRIGFSKLHYSILMGQRRKNMFINRENLG